MANVPVTIREALDANRLYLGRMKFSEERVREIDASLLTIDLNVHFGFVCHKPVNRYFLVAARNEGRSRPGPYRTVDIYVITSSGNPCVYMRDIRIIMDSPVFLSPLLNWVNFNTCTYYTRLGDAGDVEKAWKNWLEQVERHEADLPPPSPAPEEEGTAGSKRLTARKTSGGLSPAAQKRAKKSRVALRLEQERGDAKAASEGPAMAAEDPVAAMAAEAPVAATRAAFVPEGLQ